MSIKYGTFKTNWNCYLMKVKRLKIRFKVILKEDDWWILVEIKTSLVLKVVSN